MAGFKSFNDLAPPQIRGFGARGKDLARDRHVSPPDSMEVAFKQTLFDERRKHTRHKLKLGGRYMLPDGGEFPCETVDICSGGVSVRCLQAGRLGERVVLYIEELGRLEGEIVRRASGWFAMELRAPASKQDRLERRIAWLVRRQDEGVVDRRSRKRVDIANERTVLRTIDGNAYSADLIDVSLTGAAVQVDATLPIGARVTLGEKSARVARVFSGGLAVTFD